MHRKEQFKLICKISTEIYLQNSKELVGKNDPYSPKELVEEAVSVASMIVDEVENNLSDK